MVKPLLYSKLEMKAKLLLNWEKLKRLYQAGGLEDQEQFTLMKGTNQQFTDTSCQLAIESMKKALRERQGVESRKILIKREMTKTVRNRKTERKRKTARKRKTVQKRKTVRKMCIKVVMNMMLTILMARSGDPNPRRGEYFQVTVIIR